MARNRSIIHRKRKSKKGFVDVDITSLLDILVILLVFLLRSYNSSGITINIPKDITIPDSNSSQLNSDGIMIQLSRDSLWVDSETIIEKISQTNSLYDDQGRRVIPLYNYLVKKRKEVETLRKVVKGANEFEGTANLIVDKSIKYSFLKKVMYTAAEAGYQKFKFVVRGEEQ